MAGLSADRAIRALDLIAAEIEPLDDPLPEFLGRLTAAVAKLVGAARVGFFLLENEQLSLLEGAHGLDDRSRAALRGIPCRTGGEGPVERIVHGRESLRARVGPENPDLAEYRPWLETVGATDTAAVPWAVGRLTLGLLAVFDSADPDGFSEADLWVLRVSAMSAALVWQQRQLSERLVSHTAHEAESMRDLAERMSALDDTKRHILNLAAHELRSPLAVIGGYLSMVADASLDAAAVRRILPILLGKVAQMNSLVTQMLEVARLDEGRIELDGGVVDLGEVARGVADVAGLLAPEGISLLLEIPSNPVRVDGDRERIATIVGNLIDNAVKYSPGGGLVRCAVGQEGQMGFVRVSDQGLGIAPEDMARLFTRFGRILTSENSHIGGTGLGLHLSRELARLQGGDIEADSTLGRGSIFTLRLPLHPQQPS